MNVNGIGEFIGVFLIVIAGIISVISAFGLIRFPDVYSRAHAATKSSTLAVLIALFGAFIYFWVMEGIISVRLILGIIFVYITSPTAGHLIIRAAYRSGVKMTESTMVDELAPVLQKDGEKAGE